ncbi:MAG: ABC transporter permease [Lachnospiraceae bacterium]|nr:ABC transporter permease [Lachnospiraceae bacterium]
MSINSNSKKIPLYKKINFPLVIGGFIVAIFLIMALFPGLITRFDPDAVDQTAMLKSPSTEHLFGTDNYGRDIFTRCVYATRIDLLIGVFAMLVPCIFGTLIGLYAGYYGGRLDMIIMRIFDIFMAFPYMVLAIAIVAITGAGLKALFISIWIVGWKEYARLIRSEVLVAKNAEYVQAAKVLGYSDNRIMFFTILPNVFSSALVYGASDIVMCMMSSAALSYLGLGVQPPTSEWGAIMAGGKNFFAQASWISTYPGLFLIISGLGFSLVGDGLSDMIRTKKR